MRIRDVNGCPIEHPYNQERIAAHQQLRPGYYIVRLPEVMRGRGVLQGGLSAGPWTYSVDCRVGLWDGHRWEFIGSQYSYDPGSYAFEVVRPLDLPEFPDEKRQ